MTTDEIPNLVLVSLIAACTPDIPVLPDETAAGDGGGYSGFAAEADNSIRALKLRAFDNKGAMLRVSRSTPGQPRRLISSTPMRWQYDARRKGLTLRSALKPAEPCVPIPISPEVSSVSHCQVGHQQWNPEADSTVIDAISVTHTSTVAAAGTQAPRTEIPDTSDFGIVPVDLNGDENADTATVGAVFVPDGKLVGAAIMMEEVGVTLEVVYDDDVVTGLRYTFATEAGDSLFLEVEATELGCGSASNPCLQVGSSFGAAMTTACWGLAGSTLVAGVAALSGVALAAVTWTPAGMVGRIFGAASSIGQRIYRAGQVLRTSSSLANRLGGAFLGGGTVAVIEATISNGHQFSQQCM